ncbi:MAG: hypothetical protein AB7F20_04195 [Geoalkalibacter sp.]|jgi:ABC-type lipoprotein export system ATPase subunit|uniref:hypothetical protein n=1 Tax=Geoalkalibacter sp. TaxID=3041440 RepID=UPI002A9EC336|nr:hypothetical protein [Thermodesulfobacteriota bacterium]
MAFIEIQNLTRNFQNGNDCVQALRGADIIMTEGTFLGVMGPSGSGKNTFLSILGGLCGPSGGRVAIARALVNEPPLILADEPTGSLDSATSKEIMDLPAYLNQEGQTIVMVTHNQENTQYFQRTISLRDGQVDSDRAVFTATTQKATAI